MAVGRPPKSSVKKKTCNICKKTKPENTFYRVESALFPDGRIDTCNDCVKETVDITNVEEVISFFRQIDKPFFQEVWERAKEGRNHPIGTYMRQINSLGQYKGKTFKHSDAVENLPTTNDVYVAKVEQEIETDSGMIIEFKESLISKWGLGYSKPEYLRMEKYYQDMMLNYDVSNINHKQMLMQLAKLTIEMDSLIADKDYTNYKKVSDAYDGLLKSTGFRPIDKKSGSDAVGMNSFSQVWAEIEREGFVPPKMIEYEKDDIDYMLMYYQQFVQRLVGKSVSTEPDHNWRDEVIDVDNAHYAETHDDAEE